MFLYKLFIAIIVFLSLSLNLWGDQYVQLWHKGKLEQAISGLQKQVTLFPDDKKTMKRIRAMKLQKKRLDMLIEKASKEIGQKHYIEAENILQQAALISSNYPDYRKMTEKLEKKKRYVPPVPSFAVPDTWLKPTVPDMHGMESFTNTAAISTAYNLLRQLYGKLTVEEEKMLKKQFAQYYEYPCDEVISYFKKMIPTLYKAVSLKTKLSFEMEGYGIAAAEANNALQYQSEPMAQSASAALLRRRAAILAIQRQLNDINMHLNPILDAPDAKALKKKHQREFEKMMHMVTKELVGTVTNANVSVSLDGTWEIGETDMVEGLFLKRKTHMFALASKKSADIPNADNLRFFMEPLDGQKVFFKTMADMGNGYLLLFYTGYRKGKGWDPYNRMIVKRVSDSVYAVYSDDRSLHLPWVVYLHPKEKTLEVKKDIFWGLDSSNEYYYNFKFHKTGNGRIVPKVKPFGNHSWNVMEKHYMRSIKNFQKLTKEQKQIDFAKIKDDERYNGSILHDFALSRHNQMLYEQRRAQVKDLFPLDIQKDNFVLDLEKEDVAVNPIYIIRAESVDDIETTHSLKEGWLKIWKLITVKTDGPPIPRKKILMATYTWDPPRSQYKAGEVWDANLGGGGLSNASWRLVLPTMKDARTAHNFIIPPLIDFYAQKKKPMMAGSIKFTKENLGLNGGVVQLELLQGGKVDATVQYQFGVKGHEANEDKKVKYIDQEEQVRLSKKDFYELQIKQLRGDIARYKEMRSKAASSSQRKELSIILMGKKADLQQEKDLLAELETGNFRHTVTKWDRYNAKLSEVRFLKGSAAYQKKIKRAEYHIDMIKKIGMLSKKMIAQDDLGVRNWAERQREKALNTGDDEKLMQTYVAMRKRYQQNLLSDQAKAVLEQIDAEDVLARAEGVKSWAEFGVMAGTMGITQGSMYLYAGYTGITNGISDGIGSGIKHAITSLNMATMVVGSAYDGYNTIDPKTGKKAGIEGAAKHAGKALVLMGVLHAGIKGAVKTATVAEEAYRKYGFQNALTDKEREMSLSMVKRYEEKIKQIEKLAERGEKDAAKTQSLMLKKETAKLMANPHAKNYLKYHGSEITRRIYLGNEKKIQRRVVERFKHDMQKRGWDKFEVQEFRNAASGDSIGMDWDLGLVEKDLKTIAVNGKEVKVIIKNGKPMTIEQFQNEGRKVFNAAYKKVTGYSAEGSFANLTTSAHAESFADVGILTNPAMADKELAEETANTVKYKAKLMQSEHSAGFVTKVGKIQEDCRGMAKEIKTKLIPNLLQAKNLSAKAYKKHFSYLDKLEDILGRFGKNEIDVVQAERAVKNLTGKSLTELPEYIGNSVKKAILSK